jgi:two-component system cell cycle sensor histidine kinase/response regulator CckA
VLLVEDEEAVRRFAVRALAARGHTVLEADCGESALDLLGDLVAGRGASGVDLLVSDVVMPGVDGHTLSRLVREERPDLKVILMSGYADEALAPGLDSGVSGDPAIRFLPKPFTLSQLADAVEAVLADV